MSGHNFFRLWFKEIADGLIAYKADLCGMNEYQLMDGQRIDEWPSITLHVKGKHAQDYLFCTLTGWLPLSARAQRAILECGIEGVQFLPVRVVHDTGSELPGYALLNVLNVVSALDRDRTTWLTKDRDRVEYPELNILKVVLMRDAVAGMDIFRLREKDTQVYVSQHLKRCMERAGATMGFKFIPVPTL